MAQVLERLPQLKQIGADFKNGKFHSHLTVLIPVEKIEEFRLVTNSLRSKLTIAEMFTNEKGREQFDAMVTTHYRPSDHQKPSDLFEPLRKNVEFLQSGGYEVVRAKVEYEGGEFHLPFNKYIYRESHIKLKFALDEYYPKLDFLMEIGKDWKYSHSRDPRKEKFTPKELAQGYIGHFLNLRFYEGTAQDSDLEIEKLVSFLREHQFDVCLIKREVNIFDSHPDHDSWWL